MLSYQHIYHAGCLADIHKHTALAAILAYMTKKDTAMTYIETHAGRGLYNLNAPEAKKTQEAENGILRLGIKTLESFAPSFTSVQSHVGEEFGTSFYAGSPMIAQKILRSHDKIHLMELHPQEYDALRKNIIGTNIKIYKKDGYENALAICPPSPRRGMVLIDPSFEVKQEYSDIINFIPQLLSSWPEATILLWYPVLKASNHINMITALKQNNESRIWHEEILFNANKGMMGSGLIAFNLPLGLTVPNFNLLYASF